MSGWLENIPTCIWFEGEGRRNPLATMVAGFLFFTGWWVLIDAACVHPGSVRAGYHVCGVLGTLSLIMVNSVSNAQIRGDAFEGGRIGSRGFMVWLFFGFVMGFASVIASCWILFADYVVIEHSVQWSGIALFLQNALIFIASLIFKFGRSEDLWG